MREMRNFPTRTDLYNSLRQGGKKALFHEHVVSIIKDDLTTLVEQSHKHSLLFIKKTNGTGNFPTLNACKTYSVFLKLQELNMLSMPMKFLLYLSVANDDFLFVTRSQSTFQSKFYKFLKVGIDTFIHKNRLNENARKANKKDRDFLLSCYQNGQNLSFNEIVRRLNAKKIARGDDQLLSRSTIRRLLLNDPLYGVATLAREGSEGISKTLKHADRVPARFAGDLYQIDGTRFNVLYQNDLGRVSFLCMVVALDVYSKKVVGYSLSASESFANYIASIRMSVKNTKFLPANILTDNFSSGGNVNFTDYVETLTSLGTSISKHKPRNPEAKGSVENWFHIFGDMYLKSVKGYLGDGIKCRKKGGKPNGDMIAEARKRKNIRSEAELAAVFSEAIIIYNSTYAFKNSTPNTLFAECFAQNVIPVTDDLIPVVMQERGTRTILYNCIDVIKEGIKYQYMIYDKSFFLKYFRKKVVIRYEKFSHDEILVYEMGGLEAILRLKLHKKIVEAPVNRSPQDNIELYEYAARQKKWVFELTEEVKAFKKLICHVPIEATHYKIDSKEVMEDAEDALIQKEIDLLKSNKSNQRPKKEIAAQRKKTVKIKRLAKAVLKPTLQVKETSEKMVISFNDMFRVEGSIKLLD
jgi:hypothetical protein